MNQEEEPKKSNAEKDDIKKRVDKKLIDAMNPDLFVEFTPEKAKEAGAFIEDAISMKDVIDSMKDPDE